MKTALRRMFNYWLPPGSDTAAPTPIPNRLVDLAVKINASCVAMLAGAEIDWDEMKRQNAEWARLVEEARPKPPLEPYAWCEDRFVTFHDPWPPLRQLYFKITN